MVADDEDDLFLTRPTIALFPSLAPYHITVSSQVDTMIVQAIGLLDELDKEINTYAMRVKEWFGWHFPEMAKVRISSPRMLSIFLLFSVRTGTAGYGVPPPPPPILRPFHLVLTIWDLEVKRDRPDTALSVPVCYYQL